MRKSVIRAAFGLATFAIAGAASAAPVTIVFQNPGADLPTAGNFTTGGTCNGIGISAADLCTINDAAGLTYMKGFATANVVALASGQATSLIQDLNPNNSGLGVLSTGETNSDDQVQSARNESIEFNFGSDVFLHAIDFNAGADTNCATPGAEGPCGTFDLFVDGNLFGSFTAVDDWMAAMIIQGTIFRVVATGPLNGGFTIGSITVSEVPIPGAAVLLLSGLAGFGFAGRRKKAA